MQNYYKTDLKQQAHCWVKSWTKLFPVILDLMSNEVHETGRQNLLVQLQTGFRHFPIYNWVFRISLGSYTIFLRWSFAIQRFFHILVFQIASTDSMCHSVAVYRLILCPFFSTFGLTMHATFYLLFVVPGLWYIRDRYEGHMLYWSFHIRPPQLILKVRMIFAVMNTTLAIVKLKPPKKKIGLYRR